MQKILPLLIILGLTGCVATSLKPPKVNKITVFYTRSSTVTVQGEQGAVKGGAEVIIRDTDDRIAAMTKADAAGAFNTNFCAGEWARKNFDCKYQGDLEQGDWLRVEYTVDSAKSPPVLVKIK
jgi:hypothetical protein